MSISPTTAPAPVAVSTGPLTFVVAPDGAVAETHGHWGRVGRPQLASLLDFVHPDDHDVVRHALGWALERAMVDRSIVVDVRTPAGWAPAAAVIEADTEEGRVRCSFVPLDADPVAAVAAAITEDRRIDAIVDRALRTFASTSPQIWVSVHHGMVADASPRRRRVAHAIAHDGFASAVATAATSGETPAPWDLPVVDEPTGVAIDSLGDGLVMAARRTGVTSATLIPVGSLVGDDAAAVMVWVDHTDRLADPAESAAVERLVQALTLAFGHEAMRDALRHVATHDELTGLWNLPALHARLGEPASGRAVAVLDLEDFTGLNARYGHTVGDQVLVELARRLREVVRPGDFVARPSGDTFVVVCSGITTDDEAEKLAERLMSVTYQPVHLAGDPVTARASMGVVRGADGTPGPRIHEAAARLLDHTHTTAPGTWNIASL